ncbi:TadE family protein [Streptomyces sp. NPDC051907]|uniref:TadE family protein n=1 Tax=Streptomyces sp. NPDC051907 TaxID=3155284 RepID=UPI003441E26C
MRGRAVRGGVSTGWSPRGGVSTGWSQGGVSTGWSPRGALRGWAARRRAGCSLDDRGQAAIEFTGMVPIILVTLIVLWQSALVGYTFVLAGNAADKAVRAGTVAPNGSRVAACQEAGRKDVPGAWSHSISCQQEGDLVTARAELDVPLLFPGGFSLPITVPGHAAAATEWRE